jgi:ABC-type transport system involved in cytochrome bd biosynthesis fused ATPase/permease subunit
MTALSSALQKDYQAKQVRCCCLIILLIYNTTQASADYKRMLANRERLPTFQKRKEILEAIAGAQVVVISGETGCGKSTQVPQLLLDEAITAGRGGIAACEVAHLLCTGHPSSHGQC